MMEVVALISIFLIRIKGYGYACQVMVGNTDVSLLIFCAFVDDIHTIHHTSI